MKYTIKWLAYVFLYLPLLFAPHQSGIDFADKKRIMKMNTGLAILVSAVGIAVAVCAMYFIYLLAV